MNIGLDFDDVVVDTYDLFFAYAQKYTIEQLKKEPIIEDSGDLATSVYPAALLGWTIEEAENFWKDYYKEILPNVRLKPFAKEIIERLRKEGHKIIIITSRAEFFEGEREITYKYIEKMDLKVDNLIFVQKGKKEIAKENNLDVFIDDNYKHCKTVSETGIKTYIMDLRANRNIVDDKIKRLYSWPHVYQEIQKLNKDI